MSFNILHISACKPELFFFGCGHKASSWRPSEVLDYYGLVSCTFRLIQLGNLNLENPILWAQNIITLVYVSTSQPTQRDFNISFNLYTGMEAQSWPSLAMHG